MRVGIYRSIDDFARSSDSFSCGDNVRFAYEAFTENTTPILVTYIYDNRLRHIDYNSIAKKLDQVDLPIKPEVVVEKRSTSDACSVRPFVMQTNNAVFQFMVEQALGDKEAEVVYPTFYDAGMCGGICNSNTPSLSYSNHASIIDLLIKNGAFPNHNFKSCCVPVKYRSMAVLVDGPTTFAVIIFGDMSVQQCECQDTLA